MLELLGDDVQEPPILTCGWCGDDLRVGDVTLCARCKAVSGNPS